MENQTTETNEVNMVNFLNQIARAALLMKKQVEKINKLEEQLTNMQNTHNHLADIAFDEGKFTEFLMDKVDEAAREAAQDAVDTDQIARDAAEYVDLENEVERCIKQLDFVDEDRLDSVLDSKNYKDESEVEDLIENYIEYNCDFASKSDFHDYMTTDEIEERLEEIKEEIIEEVVDKVVAAIVSKLTGKENDHATDSRDNSIQVSGVNGSSEATSSGVVITS